MPTPTALPRRLSGLVLALLLGLATACAGDATDEAAAGADAPALAPAEASAAARDDVDCSPEALGEDDQTVIVTARYVVDGRLGALCLGDDDETLRRAWADLAAFTPPEQLADLAVFVGFVAADPDAEDVTLAFTSPLDDEGSAFEMAVDLDGYDDDRDEALLTLAHELAHVLTLGPTQVDGSEEALDACTTYASSSGCFLPDSLVQGWVEAFWADDQLAALDPDGDPQPEDGDDRCAADPSFLGPYAASDPEEDLAETFSAYVLGVPAVGPEQQAKLDWFAARPGLAELRARAEASGLAPLDHAFEGCGTG